ncbi:HetZ-related protein [Kovacikia minuta CCNUW1]|uniref:HetZ-related protein n=1 Tax=Kovacikia minuta TaxID=2931930 RepID=UPI001CC99641|nr:HetZ-related protein [Kovacikia minuta]UBF24652.1 HetZ-related protein [Kovacikia minuta CCNUW1]
MNIESTSFRPEAVPPADLTPEISANIHGAISSPVTDANQPQNLFQEAESFETHTSTEFLDLPTLTQLLVQELRSEIKDSTSNVETLAHRIAAEVDRICQKSGRIQTSGEVQSWQLSLARHRLQKCLNYYQLGSKRGRVDLHSTLGAMIYRYVAPNRMQLGFHARYSLIEDFLQGFYTESLKAFRRENELPENYQPRTRLELAEYMAFTEQYAKRRINLPQGQNQQLIVLRAQRFGKRQPLEVSVDIEQALESPKNEEAEAHNRSPLAQQLREHMVLDAMDSPSEAVLRDRVIAELINYLEAQGQTDCVNYLTLKLQDLSAPEIDEILGLSARQRDYLQQRFKYHVEKFTLSQNWKLVHQWLGADLDQNLGLSTHQWQIFTSQLSPDQQQLLNLKKAHASDQEIMQALKCTPKQLHKRWGQLLELARQTRNQN